MSYSVGFLFSGIPFEQNLILNTPDLEEARESTSRFLNQHRLRLTRGGQTMKNRLAVLKCGNVPLLQMSWGANVLIDPGYLEHFYLLVLPTHGQATFYIDDRQIDVSPKEAFIISPMSRFHFRAGDDYQQILLRLDRETVGNAWQRLTGEDKVPSICFDTAIPFHTAGWLALAPILQWICRCTSPGTEVDQGRAQLLRETEKLFATTLLLHQPHSMAYALWPKPPSQPSLTIRRAQAYMREHLMEHLPIQAVAGHSGVSVRHLQLLFRDHCGQSPLQWLRLQRLNAARDELRCTDNSVKISDIALRFGFSHHSEFSRLYRQIFNESPYQTRLKG